MASITGSSDTQNTRRVKFGLNVAVAIVAAISITVLLNWIGYRQYLRFDLTATRKYSLSDQTRKVLQQLEGDYRIVTMLPPGDARMDPRLASIIQQAHDVTDEYARRTDSITVQHLNPGAEISRIETLYESLGKQFKEKLRPLEEAVTEGRSVTNVVRDKAIQLVEPLQKLLEHNSLAEGDLKDFILSVARFFARFGPELEVQDEQIQRALDGPLPNYGAAKSTLADLLGGLDSGVFEKAIDYFKNASKDPQTPDSIKEQLLELVARFTPLQRQIRATKIKLDSTESVDDYDTLLRQLSNPQKVVIVGPGQVQVVALDELFRQPDQAMVQPGQIPELRFQGEEKITGALVSMSMENPPLIVFVHAGPRSAIGFGGAYQQVARRLESINFKVEQWNPMGRQGPMGRPMPAGPEPEPEPGQKAVWIVLPQPPPNPQNPMAAIGAQQVPEAIQRRLDNGDGVMFLLGYNPMSFMGGGEAISKMISPFGITAQMDRAVLQEVRGQGRQMLATARFEISQWPNQTPMTKALGGLRGMFELPSPLEVAKSDDSDVWPLVKIRKSRLWAENRLQGNPRPEYDEAKAADSFLIAAAAQKNKTRIVVTTASHNLGTGARAWASDQMTNYGPFGPGTGEVLGSLWPANAELFVNCVLWLTGHEELIAASARSQDIRRVKDITPQAMVGLRWILMPGLPIAAFAAGIGVWLTRRKT